MQTRRPAGYWIPALAPKRRSAGMTPQEICTCGARDCRPWKKDLRISDRGRERPHLRKAQLTQAITVEIDEPQPPAFPCHGGGQRVVAKRTAAEMRHHAADIDD